VPVAPDLHTFLAAHIPKVILLSRPRAEGEPTMQLKEAYLQQAVMEVEDLSERVALLKARIARQKVSVTLQHRWELEYVRNRFADFKRRVEELEDANEDNLEEARKASELAWHDLEHAVDSLLSALS
jgi:hypothetical protein